MSQDNNDIDKGLLLNHEYDGIRELDYPLPTWWLATFFVTIIFGTIYWMHYELSDAGPSSSEELAMDMAEIQSLRSAAQAAAPKVTEESLAALMDDSAGLEAAKAEYIGKCAACHANDGGGLIGPNLTDNHWKNTDGTLVGIHDVLVNGVVEKGMPAWRGLIAEELLQKVTAYVGTMKGTTPANPKEAEGTLYE